MIIIIDIITYLRRIFIFIKSLFKEIGETFLLERSCYFFHRQSEANYFYLYFMNCHTHNSL